MEAFINFVLLSGIIPLTIFFVKKKAFDFTQPILPFIWVTAIASLYEIIGTDVLQINTSYWFQIYPFLEISTLYYFFLKLFKGNYRILINLLLIVLLIIYGCSFSLWKDDGSQYSHGLNKTFITITVLICSFLWFKSLFENVSEESLWNLPHFYYISALLLYYSSTMLLFSFGAILYGRMYVDNYWWINIFATLLLRILLTTGACKMKYN